MVLPPVFQRVLEWPCTVALVRRVRSDVAAAANSAIIKHHWQLYTLLFIMIIINGIVNPVTLPLPVERVVMAHPRPPLHATPLVSAPEIAAKSIPQAATAKSFSRSSADASKAADEMSHAHANASTSPLPASVGKLSFDTCLVDPPSGVSIHVVHERVPAYDVDEVDAHVLQVMSALKSMGHSVRLFAYAPHPRVGAKHTSRLRELGIPCAGPGCDVEKAPAHGGGEGKADAEPAASGGQVSAARQLQEELANAQGPHVVVLAWLPHWSASNKRKIADLGCLAHKAAPPSAPPRRIILASASSFLKLEKRTLRPAHSHERPVIYEPVAPDAHDLSSFRQADALLLASDREVLASSPHLPRALSRVVVPPTLPLPPLPLWWEDARHSTRANVLFIGSGHDAEHVAALDWLEGHAMPALREGRASVTAGRSAAGSASGADCWLRNVQLHVIGDGWERRMARQCGGGGEDDSGQAKGGARDKDENGGHGCPASSGSVYLGRVSDDALILAMSHFRLLVLPLLHNGSQAVRPQVAALHAMAYGLPVVASSAAAQGLFLPQEAWRWHAVGGASVAANGGGNAGGRGPGRAKGAPLGMSGGSGSRRRLASLAHGGEGTAELLSGSLVSHGSRAISAVSGSSSTTSSSSSGSGHDPRTGGSSGLVTRIFRGRRHALGWDDTDASSTSASSSSSSSSSSSGGSKGRKAGGIRPMKVPVLVRDDPDRLLQTIAAVYSEERLWKAMSHAGRHHVSLYFDPPLVRYPLTHALCSVLAAPANLAPCSGAGSSSTTALSVSAGASSLGSTVASATGASGTNASSHGSVSASSSPLPWLTPTRGAPSTVGHRSPPTSSSSSGNVSSSHDHGHKVPPGGNSTSTKPSSAAPTAGTLPPGVSSPPLGVSSATSKSAVPGGTNGPAASSAKNSTTAPPADEHAGPKASATPATSVLPPVTGSPSTAPATTLPPPPTSVSSPQAKSSTLSGGGTAAPAGASASPVPSQLPASSPPGATLGQQHAGDVGTGATTSGSAATSAGSPAAGGDQSVPPAHGGSSGDGGKEASEESRAAARSAALAAFMAAREAAAATAALHHVPAGSSSPAPLTAPDAASPPPMATEESPTGSGKEGGGSDVAEGSKESAGGSALAAEDKGERKGSGDGDGKQEKAPGGGEGGVDAVVVKVATFSKDDFAHATMAESEGTMEVVDLDEQGVARDVDKGKEEGDGGDSPQLEEQEEDENNDDGDDDGDGHRDGDGNGGDGGTDGHGD
eukprot:jgi/Mesvir1/21818/Mv04203-RA.1